MSVRRLARLLALLALVPLPCEGQEPQPVRLLASSLAQADGVQLTYAWRYARGDGAERALPGFDDGHWQHVRPALATADLPPRSWTGVGWFRRHVIVEPSVQSMTLVLRVAAAGMANVYLDGRLVLTVGQSAAPSEVPGARSDAALVRLPGASHLIAVRYVYPREGPRPGSGIGFLLSLSALGPRPAGESNRLIAVKGALVTLPLFLALFHLALFAVDRRARENLFYACEMVVFAAIVLHDYRETFFATDAQREFVDGLGHGGPPLALLFVLLTYYAVRVHPYPRSRRLFIVAGLLLFVWSYAAKDFEHYGWSVYFAAVIVEVVRLERSRRSIRPEAAGAFLVAFAVAGVAIALQVLINFGLLESVAGLREVYLFGIAASAAGMSLYLARRMERSRLIEFENERKSLELTHAREIQLSMLPRHLPRVNGLDIAAASETAAEVGGDYYDARLAGDDGLILAVGDATGHGVAAGILVAAAKALFSSLPTNLPVAEMLARCDSALRSMQLSKLRMCLALAHVSPGVVSIASAAMPPVLLHRRSTSVVEELGTGGLPLGGRLRSTYEERRTALAPGDTLLFSSDGFAELLDPEGEQLGYERAVEWFSSAADAETAHQIIDRLMAAASSFRANRALNDDITFVAIRVK